MPLIAHNGLPAFSAIKKEGGSVERSPNERLPTLCVGLLNLVPDAVLQATERQFMRLMADFEEANVYVYPVGVASEHRSEDAREHTERYYECFASLKEVQLDALIVTGANPRTDKIESESFWNPMLEVIDWARERECSVLCSCLAVHAVMQAYFDTHRELLPQKQWGIYGHRKLDHQHALVQGVDDGWAAPHSHRYNITREQIEASGGQVLFHSEVAGVHLAVSAAEDRFVYFQGHPEYDPNSLLKEYKREVFRWLDGERKDYPPYPENYLPAACVAVLKSYREDAERAKRAGQSPADFPEADLVEVLDAPWIEDGKRVYHNWLRDVQRSKADSHSRMRTAAAVVEDA